MITRSSQVTPSRPVNRLFGFGLNLCAIVGSGLLAVSLGQDASWDLKNYHFYNPYAFLNGRLGLDFAPAQLQSFFNPLLDIPFYWAINHLQPWNVGFLYGAIQGLNAILVYFIAFHLIQDTLTWRRRITSLLMAACGFFGAINLSELGTTFGDNLVSIPLLGATLLVVMHLNEKDVARRTIGVYRLIFAGGLAGLSTAVKLTCAPFAAAGGAALLFPGQAWGVRLKAGAWFALGGVMGFAIGGGFWFGKLWLLTGNPLFPYFNDLFNSPLAIDSHYRDLRFMPGGFLENLLLPFTIIVKPKQVCEQAFRDLRLPAYYSAMLLFVIVGLRRRRALNRWSPGASYLCWMLFIAYMLWLLVFSIYRYLSVLELLAPLMITIVLFAMVNQARIAAGLSCALALFLAITVNPPNWGRTTWGQDYFGVEIPALPMLEKSLILMTGFEPTGYLVPSFPSTQGFLRIQSNFTGSLDQPNGADSLMRARVANHRGPLAILLHLADLRRSVPVVASYGLRIVNGECRQFRSRLQKPSESDYLLCPLQRLEQHSEAIRD